VTYKARSPISALRSKYGAGLRTRDRARPVRRADARRRRRRAGGSRPLRRRNHRAAQPRRRHVWRCVQRRRCHYRAGLEKRRIAAGAMGGWNAVTAPADWGGQALPQIVNAACTEMWHAASIGFANGPMLTMAAIDALNAHGTDELKRIYLEKLGIRRMDGHDAAHRAAGRLRRRGLGHPRRRARPTAPIGSRPEDLHHLWRARFHRQHHPFRAGAAARCATRHARHFAVFGAEIFAESRRLARRAQRHPRPFGRAQARHSRLTDLHHDPRRRRRRDRLSDRRGKRRHGRHVHHDEPRTARRRPARRRCRRMRHAARRLPMRATGNKAAPSAPRSLRRSLRIPMCGGCC